MLISILIGVIISITIGTIFKYVLPHPVVPTRDTEQIKSLTALVSNLPSKILDSIIGSTSHHKGKLGELVAYLNLRGSYDKIIPMGGGIVDYICIRWPKDNDPGIISFIDIKNGKAARLSSDQKMINKLISGKNIEFIKIQINTEIENYPPTDSEV